MITSNVKIRYNQNEPLNGAFAYLINKFKDQNISEGIVKINVSSTNNKHLVPVIRRDFITDLEYWRSDPINGSWYEVDFLQNNFYLKSYVIRDGERDFFEKWQVLGSNDGIHFDLIDDVKDYPAVSTFNYVNISFKCKYPKTRRIFRIVANGKRAANDYHFVLHRIEFFGEFVMFRPDFMKTCKCKNYNSHLLFYFIVYLLMC